MMPTRFDRRELAIELVSLAAALGIARVASGAADSAGKSEISHTAAAIHQEMTLKASPDRVYRALIETAQFDKIVRLTAATHPELSLDKAPTEISPDVGGAFSLFGGHITGRNLELLLDKRIVQAWRAGSWPPGIYSIARFELADQAGATHLTFDHTGFPPAAAQSLAKGWHEHYWEPLAKYLAGAA